MNSETPAGGDNRDGSRDARSTRWRRLMLIFKVVEVRLRFIGVLIVVGLFLGYWDTITNHWNKLTRPGGTVYHSVRTMLGERTAHWLWPQSQTAAVQSNTEYYCPMHPKVVRESLDPDGSLPKCPICGMPLSLRKKGETPKLPPGVLSRKQYSPEQIQAAGISTVEVAYRPLEKEITTVGTVIYDESRRSRVVVRASGYLEKLHVNKPWVTVKEGEPLGEIYSPDLYSAARELLVAMGNGGASDLAKSAREKLRLLGVGEEEIDEIVKSGRADRRLVLRAPFSGHLIRKDVVEGAHVEAGQTLFELADLSRVWIEAEVYETDIDFLRKGQTIEATFESFPGRVFTAKVSLIHPHLDATMRTNAVRFELENPRHELRPGMFATVRIKVPLSEIEPYRTLAAKEAASKQAAAKQASGAAKQSSGAQASEVLAVPDESVIDTGTKKIVYVEREPGVFDGVEAELGLPVDGFYPVIKGLSAGDRVAARGAFLVDAETRLNPATAALYVGAAGAPQREGPGNAVPAEPSAGSTGQQRPEVQQPLTQMKALSDEDRQNIAKLAAGDRERALAQRLCPVSGEPLGSMGVPIKVVLKGRPAFLCCKGCENQAKSNPDRFLKKLAEMAGGTALPNKGD
jgi:membrane fusion protein, copper/silver efflux system